MTMSNSKRRTDFHRPGKLILTIVLVAFTILSLAQVDVSQAAQGDLDPTYGSDGRVTMWPGTAEPRIGARMSTETYYADDGDCVVIAFGAETKSSAIQEDDKIVVVGHTYHDYWKDTYCGADSGQSGRVVEDFMVGRLNQDGSLDTSFGSNGMVITRVGDESGMSAHSVAIQSDGKIVVAGTSLFYSNDWKFAVVRYNSDGSLDPSFGSDGISIISGINSVRSVAIQSDGKIVVVGTDILSGYPTTKSLILVRFNSDGNLDTSFDDDGQLSTHFSDDIVDFRSVVIQPDDKIVVVGEIGDDFAVARYNSDGSLDTSFDTDGWLTTDLAGRVDGAYSATMQSNDKILVVGSSSGDFAMVRYNLDGSLDTSFDADGLVTTDFPVGIEDYQSYERAISVDILSDGKIMITGIRRTFFVAPGSPLLVDDDFAVVRYNNDGELDSSFGSEGLVTTNFGSQEVFGEIFGSIDLAHSSALQSDGLLVVLGDVCLFYYVAYGPPCGLGAARYLIEGNYSPDLEIDSSDVSANEGQIAANSGTVSDADGDALTLTASIGSVMDNNDGTWSWSYMSDDGPSESQTVTITANDGNEGTAQVTFELTVNNVAPTATFTHDGPVDEGSSFTLSLTSPSDPSSVDTMAGFTYAFDCGDGSGLSTFTSEPSATCLTDDNGTRAVVGNIQDKDGGVSTYNADVTVNNVAPTVNTITVPLEPVNINDQSIHSVDVDFSDPAGMYDEPYQCEFDLDYDGVTFNGDAIYPGLSGTSCSTALSYTEPGVYTVRVKVTDKDGGAGENSATDLVVIYDSDGGFVTGGGWIMSPEGACHYNGCTEGTTGKATFGFVSKYKNGAATPTGQTEFQFKAGDLNFHSGSYEWLVVAGAHAKYKGVGTINGMGNYGFMLTATDSDVNGSGEVDGFRIKIWDTKGTEDETDDVVVYDNKSGSEDDAYNTTELGGGSIKVHKGE
jgi:uncharacterized delta-60 repeat protein